MQYANGTLKRPLGGRAAAYLIYAPESHKCKSRNYPKAGSYIAYISDRMRHLISVSAEANEDSVSYQEINGIERDPTTLFSSPAPTAV